MDSISYYRDIRTSMFIAMVLTIARKSKQPRNLTTGKCAINRMLLSHEEKHNCEIHR